MMCHFFFLMHGANDALSTSLNLKKYRPARGHCVIGLDARLA